MGTPLDPGLRPDRPEQPLSAGPLRGSASGLARARAQRARVLAFALALALVLSAGSPAARAGEGAAAQRHELRALQVEGCRGIPEPPATRQLWSAPERVVDPLARYWTLDRPADYRDGAAHVEYRLGSGRLAVDATLSPDLSRERIRIRIAEPVEPEVLRVYLPGVELPCERRIRYAVERRAGAAPPGLNTLADFDRALHAATEQLYDDEFEAAQRELERAIALRPRDPAPYWMMARALYLELEAPPPRLRSNPGALAGAYAQAEAWADRAVERAPDAPEGHLWRAITRGRIATSQGSLRAALRGLIGGRGLRWIQQSFERAVALPETYRFFGDSAHADALYGLAQFYRLVPDAWYMAPLGARGDIGRSVELLRQASALQPTRLEYQKELAVALLCRDASGDRLEAEAALRSALALPALSAIDRLDHEHARALLQARPANVCHYSRDGFLKEDA